MAGRGCNRGRSRGRRPGAAGRRDGSPARCRGRRPPIGPDTPIGESGFAGATVLRRVGPRLGIFTVRDLLFHLPRRYDDLRELSTARELAWVPDGEAASARLQVRGHPRRADLPPARREDDGLSGRRHGRGRGDLVRAALHRQPAARGPVDRDQRQDPSPRLHDELRQPRVPARRRLGAAARRPDRARLPAHGRADGGHSPAGDPAGPRRGRGDVSGLSAGRGRGVRTGAGERRGRGDGAVAAGDGRRDADRGGPGERPLPGDFAGARRRPAPARLRRAAGAADRHGRPRPAAAGGRRRTRRRAAGARPPRRSPPWRPR